MILAEKSSSERKTVTRDGKIRKENNMLPHEQP
jgi:hypothetical protein